MKSPSPLPPPPHTHVYHDCSMDVDLSQQLKRRKVGLAERVASIDPTFDPLAPQRKPTVYKPTQADSRRWERGGKFSTRVSPPPLPLLEFTIFKKNATAQCSTLVYGGNIEGKDASVSLQMPSTAAGFFSLSCFC